MAKRSSMAIKNAKAKRESGKAACEANYVRAIAEPVTVNPIFIGNNLVYNQKQIQARHNAMLAKIRNGSW